jgi:hypothetical protein
VEVCHIVSHSLAPVLFSRYDALLFSEIHVSNFMFMFLNYIVELWGCVACA